MKNKLCVRNIIIMVVIFSLVLSQGATYAFSVKRPNSTFVNESKDINEYVLNDYVREKIDMNSPIEIELEDISMEELPKVDYNSERLIKIFDKDLLDIKEAKKIYDTSLKREIIRVYLEDAEIDIDNNGNMVSYKNLGDFSSIDKDKKDYIDGEKLSEVYYEIDEVSDLSNTIALLEIANDLRDYELTDCSNSIQGIWTLTWCRKYENGLVNPYDCVNVIIDAGDGSIMLYGRSTMVPNAIEVNISEEEAIEFASVIISDYKNIEVKLSFTRPNFYFEEEVYEEANFVRLCYNIIVDEGLIIQVDAQTGEILGGSEISGISARSVVALNEETKGRHKSNLAYEAFNRLGYEQNDENVYWRINQSDIDWLLARTDLYALYLNCHGNYYPSNSQAVLADSTSSDANWVVNCYPTSNFGIWRFVFLDACTTSQSTL